MSRGRGRTDLRRTGCRARQKAGPARGAAPGVPPPAPPRARRWATHAEHPDRNATRVAVAVSLLAIALPVSSSAAAAERGVVGHSLRGRPITVVRSGPPDPAVRALVVGAIHGNETAGMRIARGLVAAGAPGRAELLVVPTINPDGVAAGARGNAHGVDLNRNFPLDWQPLTGPEYSGTGPLSEPESRAARRLIARAKPDLTIWFHQPFGIVDRPPGNPFVARRLSQLIGLPLLSLPGRYPGSASRWQNHVFPRSTAFVVELPPAVDRPLLNRATAAVLSLVAELASPAIGNHRSLAGHV